MTLNGKGHDRGMVEMWLDRHNHKLALFRTICNIIAAAWVIAAIMRLR